jgi:predicted secreted Zn-dependent protease
MPQLIGPINANLYDRWQDYHRRLITHKQQHIHHGREAAQAIERKLTGMTAPSGEPLVTRANAWGQSAIA